MEGERVVRVRLYSFFALCYIFPTIAGEFLYPVGADSQRSMLYLMYQKTPDHIELWGWDYTTGYAAQMLLSRFTPAGVRILPSGDGFSFIDNGILKVKYLLKRSARTVEFDAPLYNVEVVHWIDDNSCYTSGKYQDNFGIFHIDRNGDASPLVVVKHVDCMYPQKVGNTLFYIKRDEQWNCSIVQTSYMITPDHQTFGEKLAWYKTNSKPAKTMLRFQENQIIFLDMVSEHEGFVIEHARSISSRDTSIVFFYNRVFRQGKKWKAKRLFTFCIPTKLLFLGKKSRLYEALLPLLPYYYRNQILYVDTVGQNLGLFSYNINSKTSKMILQKEDQSFFVPVIIKDTIFCGGQLGGTILMDARDVGVRIDLEKQSVYC